MQDNTSAKPGKDTVYIDLEDEITSIIDKLENSSQKIVVLVLPKRASVLQSVVNVRLLKRAADAAGKNIVLITNEPAVLSLAGVAGLHVAKDLQSKPYIPPSPIPIREAGLTESNTKTTEGDDDQEVDDDSARIDYDHPVGELAAGYDKQELEAIPLDADEQPAAATTTKAKIPKDKRLKVPNFDRFRLLLMLGVFGLVILIVFIIFATSVLPKAKITLKITSLPLSANFSLTADTGAKDLGETKGIIPATLQTKDQSVSQTITATGQQNNGDKAKGSVTMTGGACGPTVPSDIPVGTGLSSGGLTYITAQKTTFAPVVSGGKCTFQSTSATPITAQTGGSKYNTSSATFTVAGFAGASANGNASGGTDNIATVLSQADVDNAKQKITSADSDKFVKDWQDSLRNENLYVIVPTLKLSDPQATSSPSVGSPATTANITIKITHSVLTLKKDDLKKAVTYQVQKQIDSKTQRLADNDVLKELTVAIQSQDSPGKAVLQLSQDTTVVPIIDVVNIKETAAGQKTGDIRTALVNIPGVKEVEVKLSPFWVSKAPKKISKITVVQEQVGNSGSTGP